MNGKILIVDDERSIRMALRDTLQRQGYFAVSAATPDEAIRRCKGEAFDLLITDLRMPGMNGLDLIREVRVILGDIPTIVITAYASAESAVEALRLGVSDYITKPFRLSELHTTVSRLLAQKAGERCAAAAEPQEYSYCFGTAERLVRVSGSAFGDPDGRVATLDAIRRAARVMSIYAEKTNVLLDPRAAAEAISDMLYYEKLGPAQLVCSSGAGVQAFIGAAPESALLSRPPVVATMTAGSFPGLRAVERSNANEQPHTTTGVLSDAATAIFGLEEPSRSITLESNKVDLKYLVEQIECAAREAGLDSARTNDIVTAVNEAVLNSIEHGYGKETAGIVEVRWSRHGKELIAVVRDHGRGFDPTSASPGGGFAAFEKLVDRVGIETTPGGGTTVYLAKAAR